MTYVSSRSSHFRFLLKYQLGMFIRPSPKKTWLATEVLGRIMADRSPIWTGTLNLLDQVCLMTNTRKVRTKRQTIPVMDRKMRHQKLAWTNKLTSTLTKLSTFACTPMKGDNTRSERRKGQIVSTVQLSTSLALIDSSSDGRIQILCHKSGRGEN